MQTRVKKNKVISDDNKAAYFFETMAYIYGRKWPYHELNAITNEDLEKAIAFWDENIFSNFSAAVVIEVIKKMTQMLKKEPPVMGEVYEMCKIAAAHFNPKAKLEKKGSAGGNQYFCPRCNKEVDLKERIHACGWKVAHAGAMPIKCPEWLWQKHKPFIDEYYKMLESGQIGSGYEYFNLKMQQLGLKSKNRGLWKSIKNIMGNHDAEKMSKM